MKMVEESVVIRQELQIVHRIVEHSDEPKKSNSVNGTERSLQTGFVSCG